MKEVLVSIVLPVYNGAWCIGKAIDSVLRQDGSWELIVVDDNSSDDTAEIVRSYADSRIRMLQSPAKGVTTARLHGTRSAKGEYVFYMDADDELPPGIIDRMEEICRTHPLCDVVVCDIEHVYVSGTQEIQEYAHHVSSGRELFDWIVDNRTGFIWGNAIRRELMLRLPYIPEKLRFCEDYLQMLQVGLLAGEVRHAEMSGYRYIQHSESVCNRRKTRREYALQFYNLGEALYRLTEMKGLALNEGPVSPAVRIKVMFLYYMRLYLAVSGGRYKDPSQLKGIYDAWLFDKSLQADPLYTTSRRRQCKLARYFAPLAAAIYVPLFRFRYKRIW